ncbi:hypothetical protein Ahy_B02g061502 isoform A [Arachis hypogaea]|uniref:non-specific serine/threonine protein kinase n=1 Tax=Arachis hypogaea TaxID=3818 RepID=A0A445AL89_ARAHY|nr:hypothetical protein Ahy_B02g061502 isoform A [Arachis hypogaea]
MEEKGGVLMQRYELGRLLGQGNFAKVYHGRSLITGISIKREISVMRLIRHPHVVELYEVMATKTKIYFIMEYVKGGELFNKVLKGKIKQDDARRYFQQLISAVDYCHSRGVCHRDLKPENLLLDENGNLKVSDFGLSAIAESRHQDGLLHTTCGTPAYVAPEVILRKGYDGFKADIWSCDSNLMEMYKKIGKGQFKFPSWFPPDVKRLLSRILDPNPRTRISMAKIMESSWFKKGLEKPIVTNDNEEKELAPLDADGVFGSCENGGPAAESTPEFSKPSNLNAFDIISYSSGFDLSGLFEETDQKKQVRFTSNKPASIIISKLDEICKRLRLKLRKKDRGLIKLEGTNAGRKGPLGIDAEIFEITPVFHLVELKKSSGDTLEYKKLLQQEVRPALKDIVWNWQGEEPQGMLQIQQQNHSQSAQSDVITQSN